MQRLKALDININRKRTKMQKEEVNAIEDDEE
jgi:hypothetical protein